MASEIGAHEPDVVDILLEGGPTDISQASRVQRVGAGDIKVKLQHRGGYEHFERTHERRGRDGVQLVLFRWTARTRIAE